MTGVVDKVKAKVDSVLHKDNTHSGPTGAHGTHGTTGGLTGNTHTTGTTGSGLTGTTYGSDPTGPHDSHLGNKADPRVDSDRVGHAGNYGTTHGTTHGTTGSGLNGNTYGSDPTGPHDSHLGNKVDPRVDSSTVGGYGNTTGQSTGLTGTGGHSSGLTGNNYGSDPTGPHNAHLANKADPRVDSDRIGGHGNTASAGGYNSSGLTGTGHNTGHSTGLTGTGTSHNTAGNYGSDPTGPHDSKLANKLDPRVDSTTVGPHGNQAGARTGTYGSDPTGPHDSHFGNKADPRVDSSRTGGYGNTTSTGGYGSAGPGGSGITSGPGPAPDTAGPHKSNMLNKVDPRVDSDLNGSKTFGGNKTSGY